jgi:protease-4
MNDELMKNPNPESIQEEKPRKSYFKTVNSTGPKGCFSGCLTALGAIALLFIVLIGILVIASIGSGRSFTVVPQSKIAVIHIRGEIGSDSGVDAESTVRLLKTAEEEESIKAVVLRIDSPGGYAAASQEIADSVRKFKKPIVASVGNSAASGAYWIASACDLVVCNQSSSLGSIGVIITIPTFGDLLKKLGVRYVVIYKGKYKDLGNPSRDLTAEERKLLEKHADQIYQQFIEAVALNRKMQLERVRELATGEVFTGAEAVKLGLADKLGGFNEAVEEAKKLAKVKDAEVVDYDYEITGYLRWLERFLGGGLLNRGVSESIKVPVAR